MKQKGDLVSRELLRFRFEFNCKRYCFSVDGEDKWCDDMISLADALEIINNAVGYDLDEQAKYWKAKAEAYEKTIQDFEIAVQKV
jgi:hypothetical protein